MNCLKASELMSLRLDAPLSGLDERELQEHLATCADCRREWARVRAVSAALERPAFVVPSPHFSARVMVRIRRARRRDLVLRRGGVLLLSALIVAAIALVPTLTFINVGIRNPAIVHALVNTGLWLLEIGRTLAGATQAVLRALVMGLSWPAVAGYSMLAVGMILCWLYLVARPTSQTSPA
jgi:predicted anti-sigma-YlaC factor YlaD